VEAFALERDRGTLAEDVILRDQAQERSFCGRAEVAAFLDALFVQAFAGARIEVENLLVSGEAAALTFTFHGRQAGAFMGLPPTQQVVAVPMAMVLRLAGDEIRQADLYYNAGTLLRQLGLGT
jgi:steroid delta-isomerase-like uncharacterized protein